MTHSPLDPRGKAHYSLLYSLSLSSSSSSWLSGRVVFRIPDWLHHLLMAGRMLVKNTLEAYTDYYLQCKLNQVVQEHRLVSLITLLRGKSMCELSKMLNYPIILANVRDWMIYIIFALLDTVFCESSQPRSAPDKQKRAKKTFEEMITYIPGIYYTMLDQPPVHSFQFQDKCADVRATGFKRYS